jgi:hypothetical protein
MRFTTFSVPAFVLCVLITGPAAADSLGHFPVEELGIVDPANLEVDINLEGSTLQIAAGAMQDQDPRIRDLVGNLTRVRVQVGRSGARDPVVVAQRIAAAAAQLDAEGWARIISVEGDGDKVYVYSIDRGDGTIAGLTALVGSEGEEVVVANIAGSIDPVLLGAAMSRMHTMDLSQFIPADGDRD